MKEKKDKDENMKTKIQIAIFCMAIAVTHIVEGETQIVDGIEWVYSVDNGVATIALQFDPKVLENGSF